MDKDQKNSHFFAQLARMSLISRWSLMRNVNSENIAEHSLQVAMIAHMMALIENMLTGSDIDSSKAALIALYHDAPEVFTGDLPTPVKYQNEHIAQEYKKLEKMAEEKLIGMLPKEFEDTFRGIITGNGADERILRIVKDADTMCAYIKCMSEIKANNTEFTAAATRLRASLDERAKNSPAIRYFEDVFLPSFSKTLDEISF